MTAASQSANSHAKGAPMASAEARLVTVPDFLAARKRGVRLTMLTAYDYTMARLLDAAGVDGIIVGDSLGMVVQGQEHSLSVTLDEVIYHTRLVARGVRRPNVHTRTVTKAFRRVKWPADKRSDAGQMR